MIPVEGITGLFQAIMDKNGVPLLAGLLADSEG
jgi:hypothetical protein